MSESALTKMNMSRLVEMCRKGVERIAMYEVNDRVLRRAVSDFINSMLSQSRYSYYKVVCDETNNLPNSRELYVDVFIQPLVTVNLVHYEIRLNPRGVDLMEEHLTGEQLEVMAAKINIPSQNIIEAPAQQKQKEQVELDVCHEKGRHQSAV